MVKNLKAVCIYAGSRFGNHEDYRLKAQDLGKALAEAGCQVIYGGSKAGLMGVLADAALDAGGEVIGVMPTGLIRGETRHSGLTRFIEVEDMHARKAKMASMADGFIALPGGFGTYEELFEALCWAQIGIHQKPIGVLNVRGYYDPFLAMIHSTIEAGFAGSEHMSLVNQSEDASELLSLMENYVPVVLERKWRQPGRV